MCGIVGILKSNSLKNEAIDILKKLEYRGYDSAGISLFEKNRIRTIKSIGKITSVSSDNLNETEQEIVKVLDEYVKPAVASDGGNIIFDSYSEKEKLVKVLLQGACSGCPSSTFTLKSGIENILKEMLPGKVNLVEAVNG